MNTLIPPPELPTDLSKTEVYGNMQVHHVKSWTLFFSDILAGIRTSDIRNTDDRRYRVGDQMVLHEYDPVKGVFTGRRARVVITYIQTNKSNPCAISREALRDDFAVLSLRLIPDEKASSIPIDPLFDDLSDGLY